MHYTFSEWFFSIQAAWGWVAFILACEFRKHGGLTRTHKLTVALWPFTVPLGMILHVRWVIKNRRRHELIKKEFSGEPLTIREALELSKLQEMADREMRRVAPRPRFDIKI